MRSVDEAKKRLGEMFIIGFEGKELSDDTSAFLSQAGIGGVLYFAHNYENPQQIAKLSNAIQECRSDLPFWICVDQEGGRVQRFKDPFTIIPTAEAISKKDSARVAFDLAEVMAKELKAVGINVDFAPCVDVLTNTENKVIGDRSFGNDPDEVTKMASGMVRGLIVNGIQACVKHFPGHGDTFEDSHDELPKISASFDDLKDREFKPFTKTFKSRCNMVMIAHILNDKLDPDYPATLSKKTLSDMLRKEMRYQKLIISDDLEMQAITKHYSAEEAPLLAVQAGCDILIYRTEKAARKAYEALFKALEEDRLSPDLIVEAANRSREVKKSSLEPYGPINVEAVDKVVGCEEHQAVLKRLGF